jgi:uncharacterized protein (TIGR03437 family)
LALLVCAGAQAATISTTLTVNATLTIGMNVAVAGTATLTNGVGSGPFSATLAFGSSGATGPYTITLSGSGSTITGVLTMPTAMLTGSGSASATVTGGTGTYSGANGSFPSLPGAGSMGSTGSITLSFTGAGTIGTGGTVVPTPPTITAVQDGASYTSNVPQGGFFVVKGASLCGSQTTVYTSLPRPTVGTDGVKITFTPATGGTGTNAILFYEWNPSGTCQLAGIVPSTLPVGNYNVTVTNGTVSAPFATQVVASKVGLFTQDTSGSGLASVQNYVSATQYDLNRLTTGSVSGVTISPAKPGQAMIAWGSGLGAYANGDNGTVVFDFSKTMTIRAIVGGVSIPVDFAGLAGYAAEDQINFTLPANVPTGCAVTLQISVGGVLSAPTSISIAPSSSSTACVMAGYTTAQLQQLDQGGTITTGGFSIVQSVETDPDLGTLKSDSIAGGFRQLTGYQLSSASQGNLSVSQQGSCQVITGTISGTSSSTGSSKGLDAGTVSVTGPGGSGLANQALTKTSNTYALTNEEGISIPGQTNFTLVPGGYSLSGSGGADVGSFSVSLTLPSLLTLSSPLPTTVNRSSPLTLNWTGGNAPDTVLIIGATSTTTGTGSSQVTKMTEFICTTTAGQKTFTVPASVLTQLQANTGSLEVTSAIQSVAFSTTLKSDGSAIPSAFGSSVGIAGFPVYQ